MDNSAFLHLPLALVLRDARLFWLLALELYRADLATECDALIHADWSDLIDNEDSEDIASQLAMLAFNKDDLPRLQTISEGFSPDTHPLYFQRLREHGKKTPSSKKCIAWMQSQSLIGKGLDGFRAAMREGNPELARSLHQPTPAEAESLFYEIAGSLTKESLGLLLFHCPSLADFKPLTHAIQHRAPEDALTFLAWKIEESRDKSQLRNPQGDETLLSALLGASLCRRHFALAKKILDWNHSLAFDKIEPKELAAPWDGDASPIKLDGSITLTPADFACLYAHENFARALGGIQAPGPMIPKVGALIGAFSKKLDAKKPGEGAPWAAARLARAEAIAKSIWR